MVLCGTEAVVRWIIPKIAAAHIRGETFGRVTAEVVSATATAANLIRKRFVVVESIAWLVFIPIRFVVVVTIAVRRMRIL